MNAFQYLKFFRANGLDKTAAGFVFIALFIALLASSAMAQISSGTTGIDATGNAQSEMAACINGTTQQSRDTCIIEVQNANAAKRAGQLNNSGDQFKANEMQRCNALPGEEKVACEARMNGYGKTEGSVSGGGALRQVETVVVPKNGADPKVQPQTSSDVIIVVPPSQ